MSCKMNVVFIIFDILRLILDHKSYNKFEKMQLKSIIENEIFFERALTIIIQIEKIIISYI